MCGIAGWVDYNNDISTNNSILSKMDESMKRHEPDIGGMHIERHACLIHRRPIAMEPYKGNQPMRIAVNADSYTIVYNGELYNTNEIKNELLNLGYSFKGHSDTEILLLSFIQWKENCLKKLNGNFSFAIWDTKSQKLFLARDRLGVKPLFFYNYENSIIFSTELKTLLCNPKVLPKIDEIGLMEIFFIGPGRTLGQGIIKNVKELLPGEFAYFSKDLGLKIRKYWTLKANKFTDNLKSSIEKTRFLLTNAIENQLNPNMPLCCFLSGGIDSSITAKITSDYFKKNNLGEISTYSVDYKDNGKYFEKSLFQPDSDEKYIKIMKNAIKSKHNYVEIDNQELADALDEATLARNFPGMADIDASLLLFCKKIKEKFMIAISGECSDEIFGGYPWCHNEEMLFADNFPWSRSLDIRKKILKKDFLPKADDYVHQRYLDTIKNVDKLPNENKLNSRMREIFVLNINWFMQTLLIRNDKMSTYSGLTVRAPFCDYKIVEYAYNMPWEIKSYGGREKGILREAMKGILPNAIVYRKKSPYPKTYNPVYANLINSRVKNILNDKNSILSGLLNHEEVYNLMQNPEKITTPWYGQLMKTPQIMAYLVQIDFWLKHYSIDIV